jgi:hypothetical protein
MLKKYSDIVSHGQNLKFLVLSWKPVARQSPALVREIGDCVNRLFHRRPYSKVWKGLLAVLECKKSPSGGFFYHVHCLVDGAYVPQSQISSDWKAISGFPVVYISAVRNWRRAFRYSLKYILKGFHWNNHIDRDDFRRSMKGTRFVRSYGSFYNAEYVRGEPVGFPCPDCGIVGAWHIAIDAPSRPDLVGVVLKPLIRPDLRSGSAVSGEWKGVPHDYASLRAANPLMPEYMLRWGCEHYGIDVPEASDNGQT